MGGRKKLEAGVAGSRSATREREEAGERSDQRWGWAGLKAFFVFILNFWSEE